MNLVGYSCGDFITISIPLPLRWLHPRIQPYILEYSENKLELLSGNYSRKLVRELVTSNHYKSFDS